MLALVAAPFWLGFTDDRTAAAVLVVIGELGLLQTLATRFLRPEKMRAVSW